MTWYADLGPIDYFRELSFPALRAVGWLGEGHSYVKGEVSPAFIERLCVLLLDPWDPVLFMGPHACDLCPWEVPPVPESKRLLQRSGSPPTPSEMERSRKAIFGVRKPPQPITVGREKVPMGRTNLWVPGDGCVYVAPSLIAHYVREHRYKPPEAFVNAVLRCPPMHSEEYVKARRDLSKDEFVQWLLQCRDPRATEYRDALRTSGAEDLANWTPWWFASGSGV